MSDKQFKDHPGWSVDVDACCAKPAGISDLVVCLTDQFNCPCMVHFGRERFCRHPDSVRIAKKSQPAD